MGDLIFGESILYCRALYQLFCEWCIQSKGADALSNLLLQRTFLAPQVLSNPFKNSRRGEPTNPYEFNHSFSCRDSVSNEFIPHALFDLGFVPLLVVEHFVITLDLNAPKCNVSKEMPNLNHFAKFVHDYFSKQCLFPIKAIIVVGSHPTKLVRNEGGSSLDPPCLDAIPKFVFDRFTHIRETIGALLRKGSRSNAGSP